MTCTPLRAVRRALAACALAGWLLSGVAHGAQADRRYGEAMRAHAPQGDFHGVVRVERDGQVLYQHATGVADRRFGIAIAQDTRFRVASITKLFTAVLVLQQVERGVLELDANIARYLPDYAGPAGPRVTLRQLLTHTSGIANSDTVASFEQAVTEGVPNYQRPATTAQLVARHASGALRNTPGSAFDYNNADYLLLGLILERTSGMSYADLLARRILEPLQLRNTAMPDWRRIEPRLATGYLKVGDQWINELPVYLENWHAAGALVSDAGDLARFADALFDGRLLRPGSLEQLLKPAREAYAFGAWVVPTRVAGRADRIVHRPGRIMGANAALLRYVDDGLTVIVLASTDAVDTDALAFALGKAAIAQRSTGQDAD